MPQASRDQFSLLRQRISDSIRSRLETYHQATTSPVRFRARAGVKGFPPVPKEEEIPQRIDFFRLESAPLRSSSADLVREFRNQHGTVPGVETVCGADLHEGGSPSFQPLCVRDYLDLQACRL
ncbi:hypothetical protein AVEN_178094-1 [Araneus ventricosus]|uniref:Uncharacterized protein n=1 Tax=Araneus ventricosus TaxID=182803 RepID=A0A4Y2JPP4_ARAVE|nr:hypothetical protein AVEN_178094-1 [Araneus ventricosus]